VRSLPPVTWLDARADSRAWLEDVRIGARLLWRLPGLLRQPVTPEEARAILSLRLERRPADFLTLARRTIYDHAGSPYQPLLRHAGCEYGDLARLVREDGVEGALEVLYRNGVYLTVDEFKGRRPVTRGSTTIAVDPGSFQNPLSALHLPARSSGSRSAGTVVQLDLGFVRDRALTTSLILRARDLEGCVKAVWGVPGSAATVRVLEFSLIGPRPVRWFSQIDPATPGLHPRYRWSARALRWVAAGAGTPLPRPRHVPLHDPLPIARWMAAVLGDGRTPFLLTYASSAVRLCQAALEGGVALRGAQFIVAGEPNTSARLAMIRRAGASAQPYYGITECGPIGYGCLAADAPDDVHLLRERHAVIQAGPEGSARSLPATALLLTSLRSIAPFVLLNVSMGDQAVIGPRRCGCPLEELGWPTHLHTIRSHEKLTAGGMTFLDTDVIRVLEEVLPARFGGGPADYQLIEDEGPDGRPRLRLRVHPAVGPVDPRAVADGFLSALGGGSRVERVMGLQWRDSAIVEVERQPPMVTPTGKILHLHQVSPGRRPGEGS
jgi:hypothetical protein